MKKLLKNKKFLAMTLGTLLVGASVVATAAACAAKLTTSEEPKINAQKLTFKLSDETVEKLTDLKVTLIKDDGSSKVVFGKDNKVSTEEKTTFNGPKGAFEVTLSEAPAANDKVVISSEEFKTNFVYNASK